MEHVVNGEISPSDLPRKRRKVTEQHSTPVDHLNKSPLFERRRTRSSLSISEDISVSGRIRPSNRVKKGSSKTLIIDKRSLSEPRRSARQRREVYGTLNETLLLKECAHANRVEEDDQPPSMYDFIKKHKRQQAISPQKNDQEEDDEDSDDSDDDSDDDDEEEDEEGEEEEEEEEENREKAYQLRKERITTKRYMAPPISGKRRRMEAFYVIPHSPMHKRRHHRMAQHASPRHFKKRHYKSSTSSSDNDSDDERRFERRKAKSMARARARCLPMNFDPNDCGGVIKDRERARKRQPIGSSLADVDPMTIDTKVTFESVGGLDKHVKSLKEMVVFPLLYPEVFEKFKIQPPRGVLFYGPPGTGKTLVARALANECGMGGQNVAFFMRKGADCLSKWVGESERQLRLLFDQAYSMRPSIIFFDEIDGLAPVRSTRQDQIHSSIVSTLLALMDGLDARGEIVVIGATNRIDSIDPALRRPGRFDREFLFSLPNREARRKILEIHSKDWQPKLSSAFIGELADKAVGYCGADVKALCTEAALFALRRRFPQIYETKTKLQLNTDEIRVNAKDFQRAMKKIVPASQRSVVSPGRALQLNLKPLLQSTLDAILEIIRSLFPPGKPVQDRQKTNDLSTSTAQSLLLLPDESMSSSDDNDSQSNIYEQGRQRSGRWRRSRRLNSLISSTPPKDFMTLNFRPHSKPVPHRPRFLLAGDEGLGQSTHFAPAVLHSMEHLKVHVLDLPALFGVSSRVPEEACAQIFREARRTAPCIIYLPHIGVWWNSLSETTKATFTTLLEDLPPSTPILLLATSNTSYYELNDRLQKLFSKTTKEVYEVEPPEEEQRKAFFKDLLLTHALLPPPRPKPKRVRRNLEVLPAAAPPPPRELSETELANLRSEEENTLRELRLFLRQITWKLLADRKFKEFSKPVDPEEVEDYLLFIKEPMDLSTIMTRINSHHYQTCKKFLNDIDLITNNCLEYNPDKDVTDRLLRNRACELRDTAYAMVHADLDPEFEKMCEEICESRKKRGDALDVNAPSYIRVLQKNPKTAAKTVKPAATTSNTPAPMTTKMTTTVSNQTTSHDATTSGTQTKRPSALPPPHENSSRCSRRLRGVHAPEFELPYLTKAVEYHLKKEPSKTVKSKSENHKELHSNEEPNEPNSNSKSQNVEETNTAAPSNCDTEKDRVNAQETSPERENSTPYASNDSSLHSINTKTDTIKKDEKPSISNEMPVLADGEYKLETEPMESAESCEEPDIGHITHVHNEVEIILHKDITSTSENCDVGMEEEHEYAKKPEAERVDTTEAKPSTEVSEERPSTSAYSEMTKTTTNTVDTVMVESEPPCISAASPGFKVIERTLVSPSSCSRNLEFDDKNYCNEENRHHEVEKVEVTNEIDNEDSESQEEEMRVTPSSFKSEMERVLIKVVAVTEHYSVTSLERIHSAICNLIYKHRANEDKNMLIKVTGRFPSAWTLWMPPIYVMNAMMPCFKDLHEFIDNLSGDMR